jgi:hypothetical protein
MMIAHASIPADDPEAAAKVLAEIMGGEAVRFPPGGPHAWMAWSGDGEIELEVVRRGDVIVYDEQQGGWRADPAARRHSETHLAICVDRPEAEIIAIAARAGWRARHCERGNGYFQLAEVWVDNVFMLEFLDPAQTKTYRQRVSLAKWKEMLAANSQVA